MKMLHYRGCFRIRMVALTLVAGAASGFGQSARAALTLTLSEAGYSPVTLTDTLNAGAITYFGNFGGFQENLVIGESNKLAGAGSTGSLQIDSINVANANGAVGTLTVTLSDSGFTFPGSNGSIESLTSAVGGTFTAPVAGDNVKFQSYVMSPGTTTTGVQSYTAPATVPTGTTTFSNTAGPQPFTEGSSYALENITQISLSGPADSVNVSGSTTVTNPVPEPTAISILAVGGLAALRRRTRLG